MGTQSDDALARIEARLDRMEAVLDRLSRVLDHAGSAIPMAFDTADEVATELAHRGVDVDERLRAAERVVEQITEPKTLAALGRIAQQAQGLDTVVGLAAGADDHIAMAFDTLDEVASEAASRGVDVNERMLAAVAALETLTEPKTLGALTRIAAQADRLEAVAHLAAGFEDHTAMLFDSADAWVAEAAQRGVDVHARLQAAASVLARVSEPKTLAALGRIAEQADRLEAVTKLAAGFEDHTAMVFDAADAWVQEQAARGVDINDRVAAAAHALDRLTDPEVVATLDALLEYAPLAKSAAEYGHAMPGYIAMAFDTFDDLQSKALEGGFDLEEATVAWMRVIRQLGELTSTPALQTLLQSPLLEPRTIELTAEIGEALAQTLNDDPQPIGLWGALTSVSDPKVQKALGFLLGWARHIGDALNDSRALAKRR